jgi:two-component system alkaline phosphatase synthesis response regulator PhoP
MTNATHASENGHAPGRSILIIEDNETLALGLRTSLEVEGHKVHCVTDGGDALQWLNDNDTDLIVLDLMLPSVNGFEVLRRYREGRTRPRCDSPPDQSRQAGLPVGADDYVVKPVGVLEFHRPVEARARAPPASKRIKWYAPARAHAPSGGGGVILERARQRGRTMDLSRWSSFLAFLIESGGDIVSRETLMRQVWRYSNGVTSRTVDQHVARLRNKLEPDPAQPRYLLTVRKAGYRFQM